MIQACVKKKHIFCFFFILFFFSPFFLFSFFLLEYNPFQKRKKEVFFPLMLLEKTKNVPAPQWMIQLSPFNIQQNQRIFLPQKQVLHQHFDGHWNLHFLKMGPQFPTIFCFCRFRRSGMCICLEFLKNVDSLASFCNFSHQITLYDAMDGDTQILIILLDSPIIFTPGKMLCQFQKIVRASMQLMS